MGIIELDAARISQLLIENMRFHQADREAHEAIARARLAAVTAVASLSHHAKIADEDDAAREGGAA